MITLNFRRNAQWICMDQVGGVRSLFNLIDLLKLRNLQPNPTHGNSKNKSNLIGFGWAGSSGWDHHVKPNK